MKQLRELSLFLKINFRLGYHQIIVKIKKKYTKYYT